MQLKETTMMVCTTFVCLFTWFPRGLENQEKWENFFQSGNFEQTGRVEFYPKYWKSEGFLAIFLFLFFFLSLLIEVYLLNRFWYLLNSLNKTLKKNTGKWKQNTGKVREICQSENEGTMIHKLQINTTV